MTLLDGRLIAERRLARGLSQHRLARLIGVSAPKIGRLEGGSNHEQLMAGELARVCDALSISLPALFARSCGTGLEPQPDDVVVEAVLALVERKLSSSELARGLDWPLERVHSAISALRERLKPTGVRLNLNGGRYGLVGAGGILTAAQERRIEGVRIANAQITMHEARVLREVLAGRINATWVKRASAAQKPVLARLLRLGWIEQRGNRFVPTAAVRFSMGEHRGGSANADRDCEPPATFSSRALGGER